MKVGQRIEVWRADNTRWLKNGNWYLRAIGDSNQKGVYLMNGDNNAFYIDRKRNKITKVAELVITSVKAPTHLI